MINPEKNDVQKSVPDVAWNELIVARLFEGETTVWKAWRRSISGFNDPQLWCNPDVWPDYFELQKDAAWGFSGYGLIAVDMDNKVSISINDYSTPNSVNLPSDSMQEDVNARKGFNALVNDPAAWLNCELTLAPVPGLLGKRKKDLVIKLSDILSPEDTYEQRLESITLKRGQLSVNAKKYTFLGGKFSIPGWDHLTDRGSEESEILKSTLQIMRRNGFSAPDWSNITEMTEDHGSDMDEDEAHDYQAFFESLKMTWGSSSAAKIKP